MPNPNKIRDFAESIERKTEADRKIAAKIAAAHEAAAEVRARAMPLFKSKTYRVEIPRWRPVNLNVLFSSVKSRIRRKKIDRDIVCGYCRLAGVPVAGGTRRVSACITLGPRDKPSDADSVWKSLLDALVHGRFLQDDATPFAKLGELTFERGSELSTTIELEDL